MPRSAAANQRIREEQRAKILDAANIVFARKGPAATMDDIAAEASISHGLAYRYFANKEAIFSALVERALQHAADLTTATTSEETPGQQLTRMVTGLVESRRQPEMYLLLSHVLTADTAPAELRILIRQRADALRGHMRALIVAGQARGEVAADDPDQLVRAIFAAIDGLTHWAAYTPEEYAAHFPAAEIFLRMLQP